MVGDRGEAETLVTILLAVIWVRNGWDPQSQVVAYISDTYKLQEKRPGNGFDAGWEEGREVISYKVEAITVDVTVH